MTLVPEPVEDRKVCAAQLKLFYANSNQMLTEFAANGQVLMDVSMAVPSYLSSECCHCHKMRCHALRTFDVRGAVGGGPDPLFIPMGLRPLLSRFVSGFRGFDFTLAAKSLHQ